LEFFGPFWDVLGVGPGFPDRKIGLYDAHRELKFLTVYPKGVACAFLLYFLALGRVFFFDGSLTTLDTLFGRDQGLLFSFGCLVGQRVLYFCLLGVIKRVNAYSTNIRPLWLRKGLILTLGKST
jgi:hypothetical protein